MFDANNVTFVGTHFERNVGKSKQIQSVNVALPNDYLDKQQDPPRVVREIEHLLVKRSNIYLNNSEFKATSPGFSTPDNPNILMENNAIAYLESATGYGNTRGAWCKDLDGTCRVFCSGPTNANGTCLAMMSQIPCNIDFNLQFAFLAPPDIMPSQNVKNIAPYTNMPIFKHTRSVLKSNIPVLDADVGVVNMCKFRPVVGDVNNNAVAIETGIGQFGTDERAVVSFLAKVAKGKSTIRFELNSGTYAVLNAPLTDQWVRIVLLARSTKAYSPLLYVFPKDEVGAELHISKMMVHKTGAGEGTDVLSKIASRALYNANRQGIQFHSNKSISLDANSRHTNVFNENLTSVRTVKMPRIARDGDWFVIKRADESRVPLKIVADSKLLGKVLANGWVRLEYGQGQWFVISNGGAS